MSIEKDGKLVGRRKNKEYPSLPSWIKIENNAIIFPHDRIADFITFMSTCEERRNDRSKETELNQENVDPD
jgi:hypothetical protein